MSRSGKLSKGMIFLSQGGGSKAPQAAPSSRAPFSDAGQKARLAAELAACLELLRGHALLLLRGEAAAAVVRVLDAATLRSDAATLRHRGAEAEVAAVKPSHASCHMHSPPVFCAVQPLTSVPEQPWAAVPAASARIIATTRILMPAWGHSAFRREAARPDLGRLGRGPLPRAQMKGKDEGNSEGS